MAFKEHENGEENVYGNTSREAMMEDGEISAEEDAFMQGYDSAEHEEEDTASEAYEQAFASRRTKRRRVRNSDPFEDEEFE